MAKDHVRYIGCLYVKDRSERDSSLNILLHFLKKLKPCE